MSWKQKAYYYWRQFFVEWLYCTPIIRQVLNKIVFRAMQKMHMISSNKVLTVLKNETQ